MSPSTDPTTPPLDPARLEEGLRRLRELGYLQSPAEEYLTRRVGLRRSDRQTVIAVGLWVGGALGGLGSVLLLISAVLSEAALLQRPQTLLWLWLEITVVLVVAGALATGVAAALVLSLRGRGGALPFVRPELVVVLVPSLASSLYLADRIGRALVSILPGGDAGLTWWSGAVVVALGVGSLGSAVAWSISAAVALGRMQGSKLDPAPAFSRGQRLAPWLVLSAAALVLLGLGPYRGLDALPSLEDVVPTVVEEPSPWFLVTLDGITDPARMGWIRPVEIDSGAAGSAHPAAYWNEVFTGFGPREHGVAGAAAAGLRGWDDGVGEMSDDPLLALLLRHLLPGVGLGETIAADRRDLQRPPVWEIAAVAGRRARAVNCWATYPAARREGLEIVSDREFLRLFDGAAVDSFLVWPASMAVEGDEVWHRTLREAQQDLAAYREGADRLRAQGPSSTRLQRVWELATASDLHHLRRATQDLDSRIAPTLVVVHLNGLDILRRALRELPLGPAAEEILGHYEAFLRDALEAYRPPPDYATVILGRSPTGGAWAVGHGDAPPQIRQWAAWVLWEQGILPARDLEAPPSVVQSLADRERPATFGRLQTRAAGAARSGADLERLRSLGYIGG